MTSTILRRPLLLLPLLSLSACGLPEADELELDGENVATQSSELVALTNVRDVALACGTNDKTLVDSVTAGVDGTVRWRPNCQFSEARDPDLTSFSAAFPPRG